MIFAYLDLLNVSLSLFLVFFGAVVVALLVGFTFHEFSHAAVATSLGDDTARRLGRLSLNPMAHLDPFGALLLFLAGFGWGKPVPVNPYRLRNGAKAGMAMVASAGPLANLALAAVGSFIIRAEILPWHSPFVVPATTRFWDRADYAGLFVSSVIIFNIILAVFNFLPLAPLDGFRVAVGILPSDLSQAVARLEQYGPVLLLIVIFGIPFFTGQSIILPIADAVTRFFLGT